jgi:hypothetical protein
VQVHNEVWSALSAALVSRAAAQLCRHTDEAALEATVDEEDEDSQGDFVAASPMALDGTAAEEVHYGIPERGGASSPDQAAAMADDEVSNTEDEIVDEDVEGGMAEDGVGLDHDVPAAVDGIPEGDVYPGLEVGQGRGGGPTVLGNFSAKPDLAGAATPDSLGIRIMCTLAEQQEPPPGPARSASREPSGGGALCRLSVALPSGEALVCMADVGKTAGELKRAVLAQCGLPPEAEASYGLALGFAALRDEVPLAAGDVLDGDRLVLYQKQ